MGGARGSLRRGRRLLLVAVAVVAGCGGGAARDEVTAEEISALAEAPCPRPLAIDAPAPRPQKLRAALQGKFAVFDTPTRIRPPVDWARDPLDAHRYRQNLYKLRFLTPLLGAYVHEGDERSLRHAVAVVLDFAEAQPRRGPETLAEAWTDKVVGDRAPIIGFVIRAASCEGLLGREEAESLMELAVQHGEFLSEASRYVPDNHGLFADRGLHLVAEYFPFLSKARGWRSLARERFEDTLRGRLSSGTWLEHSSAYQFLAIRPVEDFIELLGGDRELEAIVRRMRASAGWLVEPDGLISQFGDSNLDAPPRWALRSAERAQGIRGFFGAGFAFAKGSSQDGPGYLAVTAGFHNLTHKHADELSFELYDGGHRIVTDTGLFHKDPGLERDFVLSPQAHSTLTVDDRGWPIHDNERDYGAALSAVGRGDGWFAIKARNPLLAAQGVRHSRLFLYRPGEALVLVDSLRADERHRYSRYLHLGPDLRKVPGRGAARFRARRLEVTVSDSATGSEVASYRGRRNPLGGLTSPEFRGWTPRWTLRLDTQDSDADQALVLNLDGRSRRAEVRTTKGGYIISLQRESAPVRLTVTESGRRLSVTER